LTWLSASRVWAVEITDTDISTPTHITHTRDCFATAIHPWGRRKPMTPGRREPVVENQCRAPPPSAFSRPIHMRQDITSLATTCQSVIDLQSQFVSYLTWPSKSSSSGIVGSSSVDARRGGRSGQCRNMRRASSAITNETSRGRRAASNIDNQLSPNAHGRVDSRLDAAHRRSMSLCLVGRMELLAGTG
jgi:hypothetical protein